MQSNKGLIYLVAGLGALIFLGLAAVVAGLVIKSSAPGSRPFASGAGNPADIQVTLPPGARLVGVSADASVLHAHIESGGGASIWTIDPASGRVLGKIRLVSPKAGQK